MRKASRRCVLLVLAVVLNMTVGVHGWGRVKRTQQIEKLLGDRFLSLEAPRLCEARVTSRCVRHQADSYSRLDREMMTLSQDALLRHLCGAEQEFVTCLGTAPFACTTRMMRAVQTIAAGLVNITIKPYCPNIDLRILNPTFKVRCKKSEFEHCLYMGRMTAEAPWTPCRARAQSYSCFSQTCMQGTMESTWTAWQLLAHVAGETYSDPKLCQQFEPVSAGQGEPSNSHGPPGDMDTPQHSLSEYDYY
ncbi:Hypp446 [Branchiostoma lanceolatum]|uniref:Hypp446 protein n=2 Tax=Branchiostoma lanceolatum TaxID=7740 RepID=A0A8J9VB57_BRALA|nr:Hypp446 [Branchiostoma lanceolatum]